MSRPRDDVIALDHRHLNPIVNGQLHVVENVPARVDLDTGEQLFAPATVEHLQRLIWESKKPARIMQVPVYEYV